MEQASTTNAATKVFSIPELVVLILLSLPCDTTYTHVASMRFIYISRTTSRTWHSLLHTSTPLRKHLYLPTCLDTANAAAWTEPRAFPPADPNPWIPLLLLNQRSWGTAWPFDSQDNRHLSGLERSKPRHWTFMLELSRAQFSRLPPPGAWRDMLATSPPFTDFWYTCSINELGSGRAPFVTHLNYDPKRPKWNQRFSMHVAEGVTLGHLVDAFNLLFGLFENAKFVMVESVRSSSSEAVRHE